MSRTFLGTLGLALVLGITTIAQEAAEAQQPTPAATAQQKKPAPNVVGRDPAGQPVNIKLDLTITDQTGPGEPAKRTVTMIVADRQNGSIRSTGNQVQARMFVDARPHILSNGDVQVFLGLEYNPRQAVVEKSAADEFALIPQQPSSTGGSSLNQRITLILQPGKPLIISQAADPVSDRKITVEVRAAILK
ncbi:MAG: hypothetical protein ACRD15_16810 [Vicinamibacterales bacterium]